MPDAGGEDRDGHQRLFVRADPRASPPIGGAPSDMSAWAKDTGNSLKEQFEENDEFHFIIEKA